MYAWFYQQSTVLFLPVLAMFIFITLFSVSVVRAWLKFSNAGTISNPVSMLPLKGEERTVPAAGAVHSGGFHV